MANRNLSLVRLFILTIYLTLSTNYLIATSLIPKGKDGLWGYVDDNGIWVIEPQYHKAFPFSDGIARVCMCYEHYNYIVPRYFFITESGERLNKFAEYDYATDFVNGYAVVGNRYGEFRPYSTSCWTMPKYEMYLIDTSGKSYESQMKANRMLPPDSHGVVAFLHDDTTYNFELGDIYHPRCGVVSLNRIIVQDSVGPIPESLAEKRFAPEFVVINKDTIRASSYSIDLNKLSDSMWHPIRHGGIYNRDTGETIVPLPSDNKLMLYYNMIPDCFTTYKYGFYGLADKNFNEIVPACFSSFTAINDSLVIYNYYNGGSVLYNIRNAQLLSKEYDVITKLGPETLLVRKETGRTERDFYAGTLPIMADGAISYTGQEIIAPINESNLRSYGIMYIGDIIWCRRNALWGAYNLSGKKVVDHLFKYIMPTHFTPCCDNLVQATDSLDRTSIFNRYGHDIAGPVFKKTSNSQTCADLQLVRNLTSQKYGLMRMDGTLVIDMLYDYISSWNIYNKNDYSHVLGLAVLTIDKRQGLADSSGKILLPVSYDSVKIEKETDSEGKVTAVITAINSGKSSILRLTVPE